MIDQQKTRTGFFPIAAAAVALLLVVGVATASASDGPGRLSPVHAASTIRESRALLGDLLQSLESPAELRRVHTAIAELSELSGDFSDAQSHYRLAFDAGEPESGLPLLLRSAHLRFELGDLSGARAEAGLVAQGGSAVGHTVKAHLLLVRIDAAENNLRAASDRLAGVPLGDGSDPVVLFAVHDLARQLGDDERAGRAQSLLAVHHPNSVEYALVRADRGPVERRIERMPTPSGLLVSVPYGPLPTATAGETPGTTPPTETAPAAPRPAATPATVDVRLVNGIQTGSFRDAENAAFMARDISSAGFPAEVRERSGDNGTSFIVVVPVPAGTTRDAAIRTQIALKDAGFEGFFLFQ